MPRGGRRDGAGRKKGSLTSRSREIIERVAETGLTPLQVMLEAMLHYHEAGDRQKAVAVARDAAPYCHPRLSSMQVQQVSDDDLDGEIERRLALLAARKQGEAPGAAAPADGEAPV